MAGEVQRIAVVTGANRGIGFATVRKLCQDFKGKVFLTARSAWRGQSGIKKLNRMGFFPSFFKLDITSTTDRNKFASYLNTTYGGLDILVNNAGVKYLRGSPVPIAEHVTHILNTNFFATMLMCQTFFPFLRPHARVVHVTSSCGFLSDIPGPSLRKDFGLQNITTRKLYQAMSRYKFSADKGLHIMKGWGEDPYCISYVGLTALMIIQQRSFSLQPQDDIIVNCYNPGNVSTTMTNYQGHLTPSEAAENLVKLATLPDNTKSPVGQYVWHNLSIVDWKGEKPDY